MGKIDKAAEKEKLARNRAVKGWAFKGLPEEENDAIIAFINGGTCPESYKRLYALSCRQLGLPDPFKPDVPMRGSSDER
jgi:hypothetical protein